MDKVQMFSVKKKMGYRKNPCSGFNKGYSTKSNDMRDNVDCCNYG